MKKLHCNPNHTQESVKFTLFTDDVAICYHNQLCFFFIDEQIKNDFWSTSKITLVKN